MEGSGHLYCVVHHVPRKRPEPLTPERELAQLILSQANDMKMRYRIHTSQMFRDAEGRQKRTVSLQQQIETTWCDAWADPTGDEAVRRIDGEDVAYA